MKNKVIVTIAILLACIGLYLMFVLDNKNQRQGIDAELAKESRAVLAVIEYYSDDLNMSYESLEELSQEAVELIDGYSKSKFIREDETASEEEMAILLHTTDAIVCYTIKEDECLSDIKEHRSSVEDIFKE